MTWTNPRSERLPRNWASEIVPAILKRDRRICHVCGKPGADQVDHIKAGDDHTPRNLAAIHADPCHKRKTAREALQAKGYGPLRKRTPETHPGRVS